MKIENKYQYCNKVINISTEVRDNSFADYLVKIQNSNKNSSKDLFIKSDYKGVINIGTYSKVETKTSELEFPIETERYKIGLEWVGAQAFVTIRDKETGKGLYITDDELMLQQDDKTGMEFIINMDQPFSLNMLVTSELKSVLSDIAENRGYELQTSSLQGGLTICQDAKTGLSYMTIKGNEAKGVSVVLTSQKDIETLEKLAQEFMQYSISSSIHTAGLYALLEISGNLKRGEEGLTFLTPNGVTYIPYDGDPKKAWEIEMSRAYYSIARESLAAGIDFENSKAWLQILHGANIAEGIIEIWDYYNFDSASQSYQYR